MSLGVISPQQGSTAPKPPAAPPTISPVGTIPYAGNSGNAPTYSPNSSGLHGTTSPNPLAAQYQAAAQPIPLATTRPYDFMNGGYIAQNISPGNAQLTPLQQQQYLQSQSTDKQNAATDALIKQYEAQTNYNQANAANAAQQQTGYQQGMYDLTKQELDQQRASALAHLGISGAQNGIAKQGNALDQANAQTQLEVMRALFGSNIDYANQQLGNLDTQHSADMNYNATQLADVGTQEGFAQQSSLLNQAGYAQQAAQSGRAANSDATSRGAMLSSGHRQDLQGIKTNYSQAMSKDQLNLQQALDQLGMTRTGLQKQGSDLNLNYTEAQQAGQHDIANLNTQHTGDEANFANQIGKLDLQSKSLALAGASMGIEAKDIASRYQIGIARAGLDYANVTAQIQQALASGNAAEAQQALQFQAQMLASAGG